MHNFSPAFITYIGYILNTEQNDIQTINPEEKMERRQDLATISTETYVFHVTESHDMIR
jgi:hypothetical protein